jgi:malonyl-CoA O-methyltransferase
MNPRDDNSMLNIKDVQRRFDRAASRFDTVDFVHSVTREGLLARLAPMLVEAKTVIDLGSATGSGSRLLARRFRRALVVATDLSRNMLEQAHRNQRWFSRISTVQAAADALPFADQSIDVVFANLLFPWINDPTHVFTEVSRVLRKDGLFIFATLGPDSLSEIRHAWRSVDAGEHVHRFLDMHAIGDAAVRSGLRDPVLDVDRLAVTYKNADTVFHDLTAMGGRNSLQHRDRSLGGAARFRSMRDALDGLRQDGILTLDLELVYGHCWGSGSLSVDGEYRLSAEQIGHRQQ